MRLVEAQVADVGDRGHAADQRTAMANATGHAFDPPLTDVYDDVIEARPSPLVNDNSLVHSARPLVSLPFRSDTNASSFDT